MKREIIVTSDGSHSIAIPEMQVTYHSSFGAVQESMHVFIDAGFRHLSIQQGATERIAVLEMGFGTGLNALLTLMAAEQQQRTVCYETIERYPLEAPVFTMLNYCTELQRPDLQPLFQQMHYAPWNTDISITPFFTFKKQQTDLTDFVTEQRFNLIYFDAFAPGVQPELWTVAVFKILFNSMQPNGVLTTYCSKSVVRKAMAAAGLTVTKIPGPPHKREIVRAIKM